jgi:NAD(P)-dependent dehydrogenase (short-subunit alcohol dehydrogenase family)
VRTHARRAWGARARRGRGHGGAERAAGDIGDAAAAFGVDVSDPPQCEQMVADAVQRFGGLQVAVNNAGIGGVPARRR